MDRNPLPPCPRPTNCKRESHFYERDAARLFAASQQALAAMHPVRVLADEERLHVDAVFRVVLFKDDFSLRIEPHGSASILHVRSASRIGRRDFGVNAHRIERFLERLDAALEEEG